MSVQSDQDHEQSLGANDNMFALERPTLPAEIPTHYSALPIRADVWPRVALAVYTLAMTGWSTHLEVQQTMGALLDLDPDIHSLKRLLTEVLPRCRLAVTEVLPLIGRSSLALIRLSPRGHQLATALGWPPVESDWSRLIRLHAGDAQPRHTVAVLYFAYQARRHDYRVTILPTVDDLRFMPDVLLERDGERLYVEVELGHTKLRKWKNQYRFQRFVAFCALTPESRRGLKSECRRWKLPGQATDLATLAKQSKQPPLGPLWIDHWSG